MSVKTTRHHQDGFTLIELIVAMGIFAFAATFAVASLLSLMSVQRKAAGTQDAFDNARYALEYMAKETREAKFIENPCLVAGYPDPTFVCHALTIHRGRYSAVSAENIVTYEFVKDATTGNIIELRRRESGENFKTGETTDTDWPLMSHKLRINHGAFYISNPESNNDEFQPYVIFVINATGGNLAKLGEQSTVHLQTAASLWRMDRP